MDTFDPYYNYYQSIVHTIIISILENLALYLESLIFASDKSISITDLKTTVNTHFKSKLKVVALEEAIDSLTQKYQSDNFSFELVCINEGYQFMTKGAYHPVIGQHLRLESKKKLSKSALETLAIISYKQPSTKSQIESIRGVNCDYAVQKLLEKELIEMKGREEGPGRPLLYGTTQKFMDHFGLSDLNELPKLKEFETNEDNVIGLEEGEANSDINTEQNENNNLSNNENDEVIDLDADSQSEPTSEEEQTEVNEVMEQTDDSPEETTDTTDVLNDDADSDNEDDSALSKDVDNDELAVDNDVVDPSEDSYEEAIQDELTDVENNEEIQIENDEAMDESLSDSEDSSHNDLTNDSDDQEIQIESEVISESEDDTEESNHDEIPHIEANEETEVSNDTFDYESKATEETDNSHIDVLDSDSAERNDENTIEPSSESDVVKEEASLDEEMHPEEDTHINTNSQSEPDKSEDVTLVDDLLKNEE